MLEPASRPVGVPLPVERGTDERLVGRRLGRDAIDELLQPRPELALLVVSIALAVLGVNAAVRVAVEPLPAATPVSPLPRGAPPEPLEAWAPIAARDIFNAGTEPGDTSLRLVGVGFQRGEARAVIEDTRIKRQQLVGIGDALGDRRVTSIAWDHVVLAGAGTETVLELAAALANRSSRPEFVSK